jgi:hypothetical protein
MTMEFATVPTVLNVTLSVTNTEFSATLPAGAKGVKIHVRPSSATLRYSYAKGYVASATDKVMTIAVGEFRTLDFIVSQQTVIYFATADSSPVVEIEYWQ